MRTDRVGGYDPRPERPIATEPLSDLTRAGLELPMADADVVADAIAEDRIARRFTAGVANRLADHEDELGLVIELVGDFRELNRPVGIGDAGRLLREPELLLRNIHIRLG